METDKRIFEPGIDLACKLISEQFPKYAYLPIVSVQMQGHDNRTFRLGNEMLIRLPIAASYALKVPKEQQLLPKLAAHLTIDIPKPIAMGKASSIYPYPFSIYQWLEGKSLNLITLNDRAQEQLATDLAKFLLALQNITAVRGPNPGEHNYWRGACISIYEQQAREQITKLSNVIDASKALKLLDSACQTKWRKKSVWIHGDVAVGNILIHNNKLSAIIDFGGMAMGDPACDLVIAWTYLQKKARSIFIKKMDLDENTWLRARAWGLWKATFELCQINDKNDSDFLKQLNIIEDIISV